MQLIVVMQEEKKRAVERRGGCEGIVGLTRPGSQRKESLGGPWRGSGARGDTSRLWTWSRGPQKELKRGWGAGLVRLLATTLDSCGSFEALSWWADSWAGQEGDWEAVSEVTWRVWGLAGSKAWGRRRFQLQGGILHLQEGVTGSFEILINFPSLAGST